MNRPSHWLQTRSGMRLELPPPERVEFDTWTEPTPYVDVDLSDLDLCPGQTCLFHGQPHEHAWATS